MTAAFDKDHCRFVSLLPSQAEALLPIIQRCASGTQRTLQVVEAGGVKALLQLLQLPSADSPLSHKALHMLCQLLGTPEGQQALMNWGGLPVLAGYANAQPELVLRALTTCCGAGDGVRRTAVAQVQAGT